MTTISAHETGRVAAEVRAYLINTDLSEAIVANAIIVHSQEGVSSLASIAIFRPARAAEATYFLQPINDPWAREVIHACGLADIAGIGALL